MHRTRALARTLFKWALRSALGVLLFVASYAMAAWILPPVPQPASYHQFADQRVFFGIPNFNDVISNLAFFLSGSAGLVFLLRVYRTPAQTTFHDLKECLPYGVLFLSVAAAALGSMVYHWTPDVDHLMWDRLPIVIGIAASLLFYATLAFRFRLPH